MLDAIDTTPEYCVFVDTNYLRGAPKEQQADWSRLLLLSRQLKIKIFISKITREEWKASRRDAALVKRSQAIDALVSLNGALQADLLRNELNYQSSAEEFFPSEEKIEIAAEAGVQRYIQENKIEVIEPTPEHQEQAWEKYFSWKPPFQANHIHERDKSAARDARKKHLPDAWIAEAALEISNKDKHQVLFLGGDENLTKTFKGTQVSCFETAQGVYEHLNVQPDPLPPITARVGSSSLSATQSALSPATPVHLQSNEVHLPQSQLTPLETPAIEGFQASAELDVVVGALKSQEEAERSLQIKVLGYVNNLAPLSKKTLFELLAIKGLSSERARNAAERLCYASFLDDTGNAYLPKNLPVCRAAGSLVMSELGEVLNVI